ncbi:class I SAM-dependent methyltransferase [Nocardioides panacisoli]|uniref:class I SAM-dependent methyltransferase n=1 Tax=Nocardioides panacisoli TaxID=627624 RepID=UPI001C63AB76|nr:class I SAM-dependent methyltransferase [Nocardioides panacisoli]QYJ05048.1 class I SAM-dependent methyltransferase [Nocardioides panacisoli]
MAGGWWEERVVPRIVDASLRSQPIMAIRAEACRGLGGRVLELGFGSGLNLAVLPPGVEQVDAVEPSDTGWSMSGARRAAASVPVARVGLDGQHLAVADDSYDDVLCTFTLCTIPDPGLALAEVRRVLRPGGRFHFVEHGLAPSPRVARWQRRLDPIQRRFAAGCHLSRDVPALVGAELRIERMRSAYLPGPRTPWTYGHAGIATAA